MYRFDLAAAKPTKHLSVAVNNSCRAQCPLRVPRGGSLTRLFYFMFPAALPEGEYHKPILQTR